MSKVLAAIGTPPTSPDQVVLPENRRERGRKQVRRDRARCYQELKRVRLALEKEKKRTVKYRKSTSVTSPTDPLVTLKVINTMDHSLIGKYCIIRYDNGAYPGKIEDLDDTDVQVRCMHKAG